jgi:hypothetical protein
MTNLPPSVVTNLPAPPSPPQRTLEIVKGAGTGGVSTNRGGLLVVEVVVIARDTQDKNANLEVLEWRIGGEVQGSKNTQLTVQLTAGKHIIEVSGRVRGISETLSTRSDVTVTLEPQKPISGVELTPSKAR